MITGVIFGILGLFIAAEVLARPGPLQSKIAGFAFALVAMALCVVRVAQYRQARSADPAKAAK